MDAQKILSAEIVAYLVSDKGCMFPRVSDRKHVAGKEFFFGDAILQNGVNLRITGLLAAKAGVYCALSKDEIECVLNVSAKAWRKVSAVINTTRNKLGANAAKEYEVRIYA